MAVNRPGWSFNWVTLCFIGFVPVFRGARQMVKSAFLFRQIDTAYASLS